LFGAGETLTTTHVTAAASVTIAAMNATMPISPKTLLTTDLE